MLRVEFMPMRLKPTPPSQRIRGSSWWHFSTAGNFSYILGNGWRWSMLEFRAQFYFSYCVSESFGSPREEKYTAIFVKKKILEKLLYWTNRFIRKFLFWHSEILDVLNLSSCHRGLQIRWADEQMTESVLGNANLNSTRLHKQVGK